MRILTSRYAALYKKLTIHSQPLSYFELNLDFHLLFFWQKAAVLFQILGKMLSKHIEFCIDTHVILQFQKEKLIDFFNPKACLAISNVEGAVLLLFLFFNQE